MANEIAEESLFLRLWQQHKITFTLQTSLSGFERLHIWATVNRDNTPNNEIEELLRFFHHLAGIPFTPLHKQGKRIYTEQKGTLQISEKTLWLLDMGWKIFPIYSVSEDEAEYIAQVMERAQARLRQSLFPCAQGNEQYPGTILVIGYTAERNSKDTLLPINGVLPHSEISSL